MPGVKQRSTDRALPPYNLTTGRTLQVGQTQATALINDMRGVDWSDGGLAGAGEVQESRNLILSLSGFHRTPACLVLKNKEC